MIVHANTHVLKNIFFSIAVEMQIESNKKKEEKNKRSTRITFFFFFAQKKS